MDLPDYVIGSKIGSKLFDYDPTTKQFAAELQHQGLDHTGRLYADAADQGFVMVSDKTGAAVEFTLHDVQRRGGEVVYWEFKPTYADAFYNPKLLGVRAIVHND